MHSTTTLDPQRASDFFYAFDNFTRYTPLNVPKNQLPASVAMQKAFSQIFNDFGSEPGVYGAFRKSYTADPTLAAYKAQMSKYLAQLTLVQNDTDNLIAQYLTGALPNLADAVQQSFELFGQGVMFDQRRNHADYDFWSIHGMDSTYPNNPPIGYYGWYTFIRAYSVVAGVESADLLHFARCVTIAAVIQNALKPKGVSGPTKTNPHNPPIAPATLTQLRSQYMSLSFPALDKLYATADATSPLGPPPQ